MTSFQWRVNGAANDQGLAKRATLTSSDQHSIIWRIAA